MTTTLIIIGVMWLCSWVCWEIIHAPITDDNKIMENLRKMEQKDIMDQRDEKEDKTI